MKWMILASALALVGCGGYRAEQAYSSAKANHATHDKLCRLAQEAADAYDGVDPDNATKWRGEARSECALAQLARNVGVE